MASVNHCLRTPCVGLAIALSAAAFCTSACAQTTPAVPPELKSALDDYSAAVAAAEKASDTATAAEKARLGSVADDAVAQAVLDDNQKEIDASKRTSTDTAKPQAERDAAQQKLTEATSKRDEFLRLKADAQLQLAKFQKAADAANADVKSSNDKKAQAAVKLADAVKKYYAIKTAVTTPNAPTHLASQADASEAAAIAKSSTTLAAPVQAFDLLPLVAEILPPKNLSDFRKSATPDSARTAEAIVTDFRFDSPAEFTLAMFGLDGCRMRDTKALIYEGMQVAFYEDGRYKVHFLIETPGMPMRLRLQLRVRVPDDQNVYTITLPPINIPERELRRTAQESVQAVHHEGFAPVGFSAKGRVTVVERLGWARIGFGNSMDQPVVEVAASR